MKKIIILLICMLIPIADQAVSAGEQKFKPSKFKTEIKVIFNELTLEEAARIEAVFKDRFKDACKIDVKLSDVENLDFATWDGVLTGN